MAQVVKGKVKNEFFIFFIENPRVIGCESLEEEAISLSRESSMEDDKEDEAEGDSRIVG